MPFSTPPALLLERHPEVFQKRERFFVGSGRRRENDVHAFDHVDLVVADFGENQLFLLLPEIQEHDIDRVIGRLLRKWNESEFPDRAEIACEYGRVHSTNDREEERSSDAGEWIVVVDDDRTNQMLAESVLKKQKLKVSTLSSGEELLELNARSRKSKLVEVES